MPYAIFKSPDSLQYKVIEENVSGFDEISGEPCRCHHLEILGFVDADKLEIVEYSEVRINAIEVLIYLTNEKI